MKVTRIQYPVGQGCFHSGHIHWKNDGYDKSGDYRYIYDCGSMNKSALNDAVNTYRNRSSDIDALFVSHLHEDHVNGIDHLLGSINVTTVFIPYVSEAASVLNLIEADINGMLSASTYRSHNRPPILVRTQGRVASSKGVGIAWPWVTGRKRRCRAA